MTKLGGNLRGTARCPLFNPTAMHTCTGSGLDRLWLATVHHPPGDGGSLSGEFPRSTSCRSFPIPAAMTCWGAIGKTCTGEHKLRVPHRTVQHTPGWSLQCHQLGLGILSTSAERHPSQTQDRGSECSRFHTPLGRSCQTMSRPGHRLHPAVLNAQAPRIFQPCRTFSIVLSRNANLRSICAWR